MLINLNIKISFLCLLTFVCTYNSISNDSVLYKKKPLIIEAIGNYGFIMPHRPSMRYYINQHPVGFDIRVLRKNYTNSKWQSIYRMPTIGIGFFNTSLGNDQILGNANSIYILFNVPIFQNQNFSFNYEITSGAAYLNRIFDIHENYYNTAIGSGINFYFHFLLDLKIKLSKNLDLINAVSYRHFSNGAYKVPNQGLNLLSYNIGFSYSPNSDINYYSKSIKNDYNRKLSLYTIASIASKQVYLPSNRNYFVGSLSINTCKQISNMRKIGIGTDLFYNSAIKKLLEKNYTNQLDLFSIGAFFSHELMIDKLSIVLQSGIYLYSTWKKDGFLYHRFGLRYYAKNRLIYNFSLKTHFAKADFIEFGIGYKLF